MTALEAAQHCLQLPRCVAFTFEAKNYKGPAGHIYFKSVGTGVNQNKNWHTFKLKPDLTCNAIWETRTFNVDILREEPLVAVIRNFASAADCDTLLEAGGSWEEMGRAYTSEGGHSSYRRSYSSNIYPELDDPENIVTKLSGMMFSAARRLTGYEVYLPGSEPLNAVLYQFKGDEYRPHCDGSCVGNQYRTGERVATSILYCVVPEKGGATTFTEGSLKAVPAKGDMLLFAYRYPNGTMTNNEAEHSGCPIREGKKWIATQWYRESVSEVWDWQAASGYEDEEEGDEEEGEYDIE